jgi:FAD/FMN-containing dehydrogenase
MQQKDKRPAYQNRLNELLKNLSGLKPPIRIKKKTSSNLFRYQPRQNQDANSICLQNFNHVLYLDKANQTLEAEGLTTYEQIVDYCLAYGFLPTVAPELKHITIGGATVGIGIESTCFKNGFVHDGLIEADILLPNGKVITVSADNEHQDLYHALPNSYGSLGYILRAKIKLHPAKAYVKLNHTRYHSVENYLTAMQLAAEKSDADFIEGLFYSKDELYLTIGKMVDSAPEVADIYQNIYYKMTRKQNEMYLSCKDYIFRYDPDWFWNIPEFGFYSLFRRFAPKSLRNSGFYNRYIKAKAKLMNALHMAPKRSEEQLIQDWEVPYENAKELIEFALNHVDLNGLPWVALPIRPLSSPTSYPLISNKLYFNLGCYCYTKKPKANEDYYYTKIMDSKCFELNGLKMLYSSTFLSKQEFDKIYNGRAYETIKQKYDPEHFAASLFEKAVRYK